MAKNLGANVDCHNCPPLATLLIGAPNVPQRKKYLTFIRKRSPKWGRGRGVTYKTSLKKVSKKSPKVKKKHFLIAIDPFAIINYINH